MRLASISSNRGLILDGFVLILNLTAMHVLAKVFLDAVRKASVGGSGASTLLFSMGILLFVLPPLGATLKRWHFHQQPGSVKSQDWSEKLGGCLFNPIFYFCLTAVIFASVNAFVLQTVYGKSEPDGGVFVSSIFIGLALMIVHTYLVYRYFSPPKGPPRSAFLRSPASALIGDFCLFANMALFQLIWNMLSYADVSRPSGIAEFVGRLLLLAFLALLLYFPPRMLYLAEDIDKPRTWLMILLANSPILARVLFGAGDLHW